MTIPLRKIAEEKNRNYQYISGFSFEGFPNVEKVKTA